MAQNVSGTSVSANSGGAASRTESLPSYSVAAVEGVDAAVAKARCALLALQHDDGHWRFEFEADCTIPAEYILLMHYMDEIDAQLEEKIAVYLREHQMKDGGWPLYYGGKMDISCSVKAYYGLKLAGDDPDAPHMMKARRAILERGGAVNANVFTHITLALFGQIPWRGVPFIPVEIMLLPRWFPFHLSKVSYWSRTVMVPLFILCTLKPRARNPRDVHVPELFTTPPFEETRYLKARSLMNRVFIGLDALGRKLERLIPRSLRKKAINAAETWFIERLNGKNGLGAIFPAMVNAYEALHALGYPPDHPDCVQAREALRHLVVEHDDDAYVQPCVSPVWDTALASLALQAVDGTSEEPVLRALDWLRQRQVLAGPADWRSSHPDLLPGGWAFQYANPYYPDLDDTAAVVWAMVQADKPERYGESIERAANWLVGMQSKNGGFAAFDADNEYCYLNEIPFADHGALLDPPTSDVSARVAALLGRLGRRGDRTALTQCLAFLKREQEANGSWYGRWGTNYIYGTWCVLSALEQIGIDRNEPYVRRAVNWLKRRQRADGGWGEDNDTYRIPPSGLWGYVSTAVHTAWALLALIAVGEGNSPEAARGAAYLVATQGADGLWHEPWFNAPGFPRVFYLKYHGYSAFFPLWALGRYRRSRDSD